MTERHIVRLVTAFHVGLLDILHGPLPRDFDLELRSAFFHKQNSFEYGGATFTIESGPYHGVVYAVFNGIPHTPAVFVHGGVPLGEVHLTAFELPDTLRAEPGWYYKDEDVGPFSTWVHVDPDGDNPYSKPVITARGKQLNPLVAFFNEVMTGAIRPNSRV